MEDERAVANNQNDLPPREQGSWRDEMLRLREDMIRQQQQLRDIMILSEAFQTGLTPERIEKFQHLYA